MIDKVTWPERYDPRRSSLYALNDIDVQAPAEVVWQLLVDAGNWKKYFPAEAEVQFDDGATEITAETTFHRVTIGIPMSLQVTEFAPFSRLSWATVIDSDPTSTAYHGWVITPTAEGCHVLTEETQQGPMFLDEIGHKSPGGLYRYHQDWVESLKRAAEATVTGGRSAGS